MGSEEILNVRYREAFSFIGISQRKDAQDRRTMSIAAKLTQVFKITTSASATTEGQTQQYSGGSIEPIIKGYLPSLDTQRSNLLYGSTKTGL